MNSDGRKINVLITSAAPEAKGGVVALHQVLFGRAVRQNIDFLVFPVSSPAPFQERWMHRMFRVVARMKQFRSLLKKTPSIEIVHINTSYDVRGAARDALFLLISLLSGKKIVLQIHSAIGACRHPEVVEWIARRVFPLSDKIMVFSREDRKKIEPLVPRGKVEIFPNAVIVGEPAATDRNFKEDLSIPEEGKIVLFASRLIVEKGVYVLLESIPLVVRKDKNVHFLIAGDGPEKVRMEEICRQKGIQGNVRFTGHITGDRLSEAFSCADLFAFPTYHSEGMPMVILEALAAGLPIVSTPFGAIPDILKDGINGFLIEPNAPERLAEKILLVLHREELKKRMKTANLQLAKNEFDREIVLSRLERLYASL